MSDDRGDDSCHTLDSSKYLEMVDFPSSYRILRWFLDQLPFLPSMITTFWQLFVFISHPKSMKHPLKNPLKINPVFIWGFPGRLALRKANMMPEQVFVFWFSYCPSFGPMKKISASAGFGWLAWFFLGWNIGLRRKFHISNTISCIYIIYIMFQYHNRFI